MKNFTDIYNNPYMINEGLFTGDHGVWGPLAIFSNLFSSKSSSDKKQSEISKAMAEISKSKRERNKKRMEELKKSKEGAIAAKLRAKFEFKENQLDIANKMKVNSYDAKRDKLKAMANKFKKGTFLYSSVDQVTLLDKIEDELDSIENTELRQSAEKMKDLCTKIAIKKDGTVRSAEEITAAMDGKILVKDEDGKFVQKSIADLSAEDKEIYKDQIEEAEGVKNNVDEHNKLAESSDVKNAMITSANMMASNAKNGVKDLLDEAAEIAEKEESVNTRLDKAQTAYDELEIGHNRAVEYKDKCKTYDEQVKTMDDNIAAKKKAIDDFKESLGDAATINEENGQVVVNDVSSLITKPLDNETFDDTYFDKLKQKGVPDNVIDKLKTKVNDHKNDVTQDDNTKSTIVDELKTIMNDDDNKSAIEESIKNKSSDLHEEYKAAKDEKENSSLEDPRAEKENTDSPYHDLPKEGSASWEKLIDDKTLKEAESNLNKVKDEKETIANRKTSNIEKLDKAEKRLVNDKQKEKNKDLFELAKSKNPGLQAGETLNDEGEAGYMDGENWHKKPGAESSDQEIEDYKKGLKNHILKTDVNEFKEKSITDVTKDGENYIITYKVNGKEEKSKSLTKDQAAAEIAKANANAQNYSNVEKTKLNALTTLNKVLDKDGNPSAESFKKLKDDEKELFRAIIANPADFNLNGVDIDGNMSTKFLDENGHLNSNMEKSLDKLDGDVSDEELLKDLNELEDVENDDPEAEEDDIELDDGETDDNAEDVDDGNGNKKKKILNPAKIWKRRKLKNGKGTTKNYYNSKGKTADEKQQSISPKEYKEKMQYYKERLAKKKQQQNPSTGSEGGNTTASTTNTGSDTTQENQSLNIQKANINESLTSFLKRNIK